MRTNANRWALALGSALLVAPAAWAADIVEHSGSVTAVDAARHTITIEEMGSWHPGKRNVKREVFALTPETRVELARRQEVPGGYPGQWTEQALTSSAPRVGDFATITAQREGGRLQATAVVVVRPDGSGQPPGPPEGRVKSRI
ncbi:MAG TPA: hypothetical protein VL086_16020 [Candidatus Nitrosotalea sp.]|jgi:hypothetical protein|nr:hypothetical protein [Candidatus Nitrosotalea sp.]